MDNSNPNKEWDGGDDGTATATLPPTPTALQAAPAAVSEQPLPDDYKGLMAEHQRLYHAIPREKSKAARAKLTERHAIVKSRLATLQNGPSHPSITADDHARTAIARHTRPASRAARLEKLKAAVAAKGGDDQCFLKISAKPLRPVSAVIQWLLARPGVQLSVAVLREAVTRYEIQRLENFGLAYPVERLTELRSQLADCTEPSVIKELQSEAANLALPTAATTARNIRNALQIAWQTVEDANWRLLTSCQIELEAAREDSLAAERMLFETHPLRLPHEPTSASRCYDATIKHVEQLLQPGAGVALPELSGSVPKTAEHTALSALLHLGVLADE